MVSNNERSAAAPSLALRRPGYTQSTASKMSQPSPVEEMPAALRLRSRSAAAEPHGSFAVVSTTSFFALLWAAHRSSTRSSHVRGCHCRAEVRRCDGQQSSPCAQLQRRP
jgi:hypothetical protein